MATLFDADGNEIAGAMTAEEVKAIQDKAEAAEKEIGDIKEKLSKLENKDMNFKKMRDMTQEELNKLSSKEVELIKRQEKMEEEQRSFVETQIRSYKDESLAVLAGDDEELHKKVLFHYDRIKDEAVSKQDIQRKMRDAYRLAKSDSNTSDPFATIHNYSGTAPKAGKEEGIKGDLKDLASKFGLSDADIKKYS